MAVRRRSNGFGLFFPIRRVKISLFIDTLICVGSEEVALGLDQVCRQVFRTNRVEIGQSGRRAHRRDIVKCEFIQYFTPIATISSENIGKIAIQR